MSRVRRIIGIFSEGLPPDLPAAAAIAPRIRRLFAGVVAAVVRAIRFAAEPGADFASRPVAFVLRVAVFAMAAIVPVNDIDRNDPRATEAALHHDDVTEYRLIGALAMPRNCRGEKFPRPA
jgi:hypothetical protein